MLSFLKWNLDRLLSCIIFPVQNILDLMHYFVMRHRYSPNELRYLPLNTALYEPPLDPELPALDSEPDSDDAEDVKDDKKTKNSSVRHYTCKRLGDGF